MKNGMLEKYALIVCLLLGSYGLLLLSTSIYRAIEVVHPAWIMIDSGDEKYLSNEAFCENRLGVCSDVVSNSMTVRSACATPEACQKLDDEDTKRRDEENAKQEQKYSPEAITKKRLQALDEASTLKYERAQLVLVHNVIQLFIVLALFTVHWRLGRKARSLPEQTKA